MGNRWEGHGTKRTKKAKILPDRLNLYSLMNTKKAKTLLPDQLNFPNDEYNMAAKISPDGLKISDNTKRRGLNVYAEQGFDISKKFRKDIFPGTIVYYFEITQVSESKW
jgi:hypothetical protein